MIISLKREFDNTEKINGKLLAVISGAVFKSSVARTVLTAYTFVVPKFVESILLKSRLMNVFQFDFEQESSLGFHSSHSDSSINSILVDK